MENGDQVRDGPPPGSGSATAMRFAAAGRLLADRARELGVDAPAFRSPPRLPEVRRSVTRHRDRSVTVAIAVRDRPAAAVVADMIDGVVLASGVDGALARRLHDHLWEGAEQWLAGDASRPLRAVA